MKKIFIITVFGLLVLFSCQKANYQTDTFEIFLPSELKSTTEIMDTALIQYYSPSQKYYLAVEKQSASVDIDSFCNENILSLFDYIDSLKVKDIKSKYGNGKLFRFKDNALSDSYYWYVKVLPDSNNYYVLWLWSDADKFKNNRNKMIEIVNSFKLK